MSARISQAPYTNSNRLYVWIAERCSEFYFCDNHPRLLLESAVEIKAP